MITSNQLDNYAVVYQGRFVDIYDMSNEVPHTAFASWKGFWSLDNEVLKKEFQKSLNYIKQAGVQIYISDHRDLKVVKDDVLAWVHEVWYSTASQNGLALELCIDSSCIFGQMSLKKMLVEEKTGGVAIAKVADLADAKRVAKLYLTEKAL